MARRRHESSIRVHITARNAQASADRLCTTALTGILRRGVDYEPLRDRWSLYALTPAAGWGWC